MGCERPVSNQPIAPEPGPCGDAGFVFLRDIWWQDSTYDGTLADDGDGTQSGYPFADQAAQKIIPRTLRNFAFEVSQALCTIPGYIEQNLVFYIGDGTNGEVNHIYWTTLYPTPPTSSDMEGWNDAGAFDCGCEGGGLPPGGDPGQALVKASDEDGDAVWADCCGGEAGCGDHQLTPADLEFDPILVPALPWMGSGPFPGVPDAIWMSDYGMTGPGDTATIPAPLAGQTNHIGQSFNLEWSPTAREDGDYICVGGEGGGMGHSFTFTADKPGSLDILFKGLYTDALSSNDIYIQIWPNDKAKVTDNGWSYHIDYEPDAAGTEYTLSISYAPNAPIRQHLDWDDPTLEMLFHDQSSNFSITYDGLYACGRTGEFYDQGVPDIDACYGTDLARMMEETTRRIPKPVPISGTHNGGKYGDTSRQIRGEGTEIHFSGPAGVRISGDGTYRAFVDIPFTLSLSPDPQEVLVAPGLVFDTTPVVSHSVTPQVSTLCSVSVAVIGPTFDEIGYLTADVKLMANNDINEDPLNIKECVSRSIRLPLTGLWELPVTVSMGTSTELGVDPLWFDTKWFVRVVLTDPVVDDKAAPGTILRITPTFLVPSIGQYPYPSVTDDDE